MRRAVLRIGFAQQDLERDQSRLWDGLFDQLAIRDAEIAGLRYRLDLAETRVDQMTYALVEAGIEHRAVLGDLLTWDYRDGVYPDDAQEAAA